MHQNVIRACALECRTSLCARNPWGLVRQKSVWACVPEICLGLCARNPWGLVRQKSIWACAPEICLGLCARNSFGLVRQNRGLNKVSQSMARARAPESWSEPCAPESVSGSCAIPPGGLAHEVGSRTRPPNHATYKFINYLAPLSPRHPPHPSSPTHTTRPQPQPHIHPEPQVTIAPNIPAHEIQTPTWVLVRHSSRRSGTRAFLKAKTSTQRHDMCMLCRVFVSLLYKARAPELREEGHTSGYVGQGGSCARNLGALALHIVFKAPAGPTMASPAKSRCQ